MFVAPVFEQIKKEGKGIMHIRTTVLTIVLSLLFATTIQAKQEQRLALLIGNSHYKHGGSLPNPLNDVRAIKTALEGLGFTVMKYEDCSQKNMKRAMDKFGRNLKGKDVGLFFYAGHGVQVDGHNYLLPVDAKLDSENDAEYDCVRADRVLAKMETAGSKTNIVILDACRDNPFERSWRRGTKGAGLAFMNAPSGSLIAYSTGPGKTALDGRGQNSPYTSALLQHIGTPNITVLEMFQKVRSTVRSQSNYKQTPWESTCLNGNFYFTKQGTDSRFSQEQARLERERQEFEQAKAEFERRQRESQNQRVDVASVPQRPSQSHPPSSNSNVIQRDGIYVAYANGIVRDTNTGLEWKAGPDKDTTWNEAKSWVQSLNLDGGGWRMPTTDELKTLYKKGMGSHNLTSLLLNTTTEYLWVWSGDIRSDSSGGGGGQGLHLCRRQQGLVRQRRQQRRHRLGEQNQLLLRRACLCSPFPQRWIIGSFAYMSVKGDYEHWTVDIIRNINDKPETS